MKIKKEYIILILIIIALSGYLYFKRTDRLHYQLPELAQTDTKEITGMEILSKGESISLVRKDETWYIQPEGYPVDSKKAEAMLKVLKDLAVTEMVSEAGNYVIYELDEDNRIMVKAFAGATPVREFEIGKTAATYKHTYIRLAGDDKVYQAKGSFRNDFDQTAAELRDKLVLSFSADEVLSVTVSLAGESTTLTREEIRQEESQEGAQAPVKEVQWKNEKSTVVEKLKVDNLLSRMSSLRCKDYLEDRTKAGMGKPHTSVVLSGTVEHSLRLYEQEGEDTPATSSGSDYVFILTAGNLEDIEKALEGLTENSGK